MSDSHPTRIEAKAISERILAIVSEAPDRPDARVELAKILAAATVDGTLDEDRALALARQRAEGIPVQLLSGRTLFMGLELLCAPGVFSTREETELLGRTAIDKLRELAAARSSGDLALKVVDVGSGVGNLTCALAKAFPGAKVWAVDIDPASVAMTRTNAQRLGLADRVEALQGDVLAPLSGLGLEGEFDAVVSNPPYIASVRLEKDRAYLLASEPRAAFDGGPFGINVQMRLVKEALQYLKPGGWLFFEFGLGQDKQVRQLLERTGGYDLMAFACDARGEARVSANRKRLDD